MGYISLAIILINIFAVLWMVFKEQKKPEVIISWLLLFSVFPIVGYLIYIVIGGGISIKNKQMLKNKKFYNDHYTSFYKNIAVENSQVKNPEISNLIKFNLLNAKSVPNFSNKIKFITTGNEFVENIIKDINAAKHSINIEYYIFDDDAVGKRVMNALCEKAKEGVKVKLIFDSVGSIRAPRLFFHKLRKCGGEVKEFFPPLFHIRLINLKMNYRNHRKIIVIDGKVGYVGGINIRKDHCGMVKRLSPWCDAHIRVVGQAVYALQNAFFNFWQFCSKKNEETEEYVANGYFPNNNTSGKTIMQVITSGPDDTKHLIKENMIKLFTIAKKQIIIQTPYFVPDEAYMSAIKTAIRSGVKVVLILPGKPDKKFVYHASMSYAKEFLQLGGEVYLFEGFMHAKTVVIDDYAMTLGTANADNRSFALNFEINANIYDQIEVKKYLAVIEKIMKQCTKLTLDEYLKKPIRTKLKHLFYRLFAPLF